MQTQQENRTVRAFHEWPWQTEDLRRLRQAVETGRVPHAVLLWGSRTATAEMTKFFAKLLLCQGEPAPCGQCETCRWFEAGTHPDFHTLEASGGAIRAAHIRALQQALAYRSHAGKRAVYVIEDVDEVTPVVANRLLKTLEEPEGPIVALLTARHVGRVLPTVLSRCFVYRVDLGEDGTGPSAASDTPVPAQAADGAPAADGRQDPEEGGAPGEVVAGQDGFAGLLPGVIQWTETMLAGREEPFVLADALLALAPSDAALPLDVLLTWLRDVLHVKLGDEERIQYRAWSDDLHKQAQLAPTQGLVRAIDLVLDAKTRHTAHVAPQFNYAQMCIRMRRACASPRKDELRFA